MWFVQGREPLIASVRQQEAQSQSQSMAVNSAIHDITRKNDIALDSAPYREIASALTRLGLNLAFFVFRTRGQPFGKTLFTP